MSKSMSASKATFKTFVYAVCIILTFLSIFPFWTMIVNATRNTYQIQSNAVSIFPSKYVSTSSFSFFARLNKSTHSVSRD